MADVFQYRECRATITARIPDTPDADAHPDRVLVQGRGTAHPQFQGGSVVFTEIGEYAIPQPVPVVVVDGELLVEVLSGDESVEMQPLFLPVTVDERANQNWSWRLTFDFLTLGEYGEEVKHPPLSFPVEAGDGPLEISTVATPAIKQSGFITRGEPGASITDVRATEGTLTFVRDDGQTREIALPDLGLEVWSKGALNSEAVRQALPEGIYRIQARSVASAIGLPVRRTGKLEVLEVSPNSGVMVHRFTTPDINEAEPLEQWVQATNHLGEWVRPWYRMPTGADMEGLQTWWGEQTVSAGIDELTHRGMTYVRTGSAARQLNLPLGLTGYLDNMVTAAGESDLQTYMVRSGRPRMFGRSLFTGGWRDWVQIGFGTGNVLTADTPVENIFEDGVYSPASDAAAEALGLPGGVRGALYASNLSDTYSNNSNMSLLWLPATGGAWTRSKVSGTWRGWQELAGGGTSASGGAGHVVLWGSSTPESLAPALGDALAPYQVEVHGRASGGEWSSQSVIRIGSTPVEMTPAGGVLPASGPVRVDSAIFDGHPKNLLRPCTGWLGGVHGTLVGYGTTDGYYEFTRTIPGDPVATTDAAWVPEVKTPGHLHIWSAGKNDLNVGRTAAHLARVIERRDQAIAHWSALNSDFLVLGHFVNRDTPASDSRRTQIEADNADALAKYPDNYLSMQELMTGTEVWEWTGLTPTSEDEAQMALGNLPPSLQGVGNHLNEHSERYLSHKITEWMASRGMIGQGRVPFAAHTHVVSDTGQRFRLATDGAEVTLHAV